MHTFTCNQAAKPLRIESTTTTSRLHEVEFEFNGFFFLLFRPRVKHVLHLKTETLSI